MLKTFLSAKIHGIKVTDKCLQYDGSQTLPVSLMQQVGIAPYEQVHVVNITNGNRWITYAIEGKEGECVLNGAAARLGEIGDELIVMAYCQYMFTLGGIGQVIDAEWPPQKEFPKIIHLEKNNGSSS